MWITVTCSMGHVLHVEDKHVGRSGRCPHCHVLVHVPKSGEFLEEEILAVVVAPGAPCSSTPVSQRPNRMGLAPVDAANESDNGPSDSSPPRHCSAVYHHLGVWRHGATTAVRFGDHQILDEFTVKKISDELIAVAEGAKCRHLIVNFTGVRRLSTLMLGRLLMLRRIMAAKSGRLILCEIAPDIEGAFVETKLIRIFEIVDMEADGLKAVSDQRPTRFDPCRREPCSV